jgi:Spy/CpxP family protein refolding chaperone
METNNKNQWLLRIGALVIFILGFIAGGLSFNLYNQTLGPGVSVSIDDTIKQLHLTPEQQPQVDKIMSDTRAQFKTLREQTHPQAEKIRQESLTRMKAVLNPEQWQKFQAKMEELKKQRHQRHQDRDQGSGDQGKTKSGD